MISHFHLPHRVLLGEGAVEQLGAILRELSVRCPLLVALPSAAVERVRSHCRGAVLFSGIDAFPNEQNALDGAECFVTEGCDGIVAVGSTAVQEAAKAIRLKVTHPLHLHEYSETAVRTHEIGADLPPLIAIPAGLAAGSEASQRAWIGADREVIRLSSPRLRPSVTVSDPELSLGAVESELTRAGLALFGAACASRMGGQGNRFARAFGDTAVSLVLDALPGAIALPKNLSALADLHLASLFAGWSVDSAPGSSLRLLMQPLASAVPDPATAAAVLLGPWLRLHAADVPALPPPGVTLGDYGFFESALPRLASAAVDLGVLALLPGERSHGDVAALYREALG